MPAGRRLLAAALVIVGSAAADPAYWADSIGKALQEFGKAAARRQEAVGGFKGSRVLPARGHELLANVAREVERMMRMKIAAVKELVERAEYEWRQSPYEVRTWPVYKFMDAKRLNVTRPFEEENIELKENGHFFHAEVNTTYSVVHVPLHVYDGAPKVLRGIEWSRGLNEVFIENYRKDPSLYWQYFGSALGFMRRYPASWWESKPAGEVDLFDCRTRAWYIEAATSPKDVLILVDNSGSMRGHKRNLARQVVFEILDTLGSNDFVNILSFNVTVREVVCCFKNRLVQANLANIRDFKMGMEELEKPHNISEFTGAFDEAFRLLEDYRTEKAGSNCNQAIMLITDGSPETFEETFEKWNWEQQPRVPVRVFTYLIGAETDLREMKWMACANRGYFAHISVGAEVRESVMRYISVMARPLVLNNTFHPVVWAPVYADIVDPKMTDYLWELKEKEIQKGISSYLRNSAVYKAWKAGKFKQKKQKDKTLTEIVEMAISKEDIKDDREYLIDTTIKRYPYKMMTSVSMPVYDTRDNASVEADILGVAGTDVPNFEIQRLMVPYLLGVNGYAFIVTNNGYILIHPELRPEFQVSIGGEAVSILKPNYNNVDFMDVELPFKIFSEDDDGLDLADIQKETGIKCIKDEKVNRKQKPNFPCRKDDPDLLALRERLINGERNGSSTLFVKNHYDGFRRVYFSKKHYFYTPIDGTPFELVIVLPDGYGLNRIEPKPDVLNRPNQKRKRFFKDQNWKIHPNWYYCKYHYTDMLHFNSSEEELLHFLNKTSQPDWKWPSRPRGTPEHYHCYLCNTFGDNTERSNFYCDKTLLLSLLSDVRATEWFSDPVSQDLKHKLGLILVFIATRSGLTRWQDLYPDYKAETGVNHFSEVHKSAIDETWYKRAVERNYLSRDDFIYSVPYNAGHAEGTLVTASQAVFATNGTIEVPVAVVGFQFRHCALHSLFINITFASHRSGKTCESAVLDCYLLDNHGYVVVSERLDDTGKFFGSFQGALMEKMVADRLYRKVEVHDHQAVCFVPIPIKPEDKKPRSRLYINKTRPQPCETKVNLYVLNSKKLKTSTFGADCTRPYFAKDIPFSNLILVVVNTSCPQNKNVTFLAQPEEVTYERYTCCKSDRNLTRRTITECANFNEMEEFIVVCGNAPILMTSMMVILISLVLTRTVPK